MVKKIKFQGPFGHMQKDRQQFFLKIGLVLVLLVVAVWFGLTNHHLLAQNKKMLRFIANQEVFRQTLKSLQESETLFNQTFILIKKGADLETIKNEQTNQLLGLINEHSLTVDSYRSEVEKKEGFVLFKTHVALTGDFVQVLHLFSRIRATASQVYVAGYHIQLHMERLVRLGLQVEILGVE